MFNSLKNLFGKTAQKNAEEQQFLQDQHIQYDEQHGFIVDGIILNEQLAERLEYLSNRRLKKFDDLKELYFTAMIINEKIDLEIANKRYAVRLGNTEENLKQFKTIIQRLNQYYREFKREK